MRRKQWIAVLLTIALLVGMVPGMAFAAPDPDRSATYREGAVLVGGDGQTYQFPKSEQGYIRIRYIDLATGKWKYFDGQYESGDPKRSYVIEQNGTSYRGYCVEHGVHVDSSKKLTASEQHNAIYAGLSNEMVVNLQLALFYGYQSGDSISDLYEQGFSDSKYYGKNGSSYAWADWYIATQCLVWEIQQGNRTENMTRQKNECGVSGDHYLSMLSGRPAVDVYNWMVGAIKEHKKFPKAVDGTEKKPKTITLSKGNKTEDGYTWTFKDTTGFGGDYIASHSSDKSENSSKVKIKYDKSSGKYVLTLKGEPKDGIYKIQHAAKGKAPEKDLLFWGWQSDSSHVQTIVTGAADPVAAYVRFKISEEKPEPEAGEKPKPEFFPTFEIPVSKEDSNPGWDGDKHTGMGDASLGATYTLYRSVNGGTEELIDQITLDEYGTMQTLYDQPWTDVSILTESTSGSREHKENHCVVEPTKTEWSAEVTYRLVETSPAGRHIKPDSGQRTYTATYQAATEDQRECMDDPENWTDITYSVEWTHGSISGKIEDLDENIAYDESVFVNDCYRGRLFLSKSNESEDVFEEEGSSGVQDKSQSSKWKMYLKSGGWENHPYLSFIDEGLDTSGTRVYKAVRDNSGLDNAKNEMTVGTNGCIYIYDIPYGTYRVEEVKADDNSFVLESFDQFVGEDDARYDWNIRDKKKENVVKVIKTDSETGKSVNLKGTKFYIRYMGNPLLSDPTQSKNYGRLLPNSSNINSSEKDYTFECDEYGKITIPYDLEFGTYRLEEWLVPDGYYLGKEGVNYYIFQVEKQNVHLYGTEYEAYYQDVIMPNNPVKGKISIEKEGEGLSVFVESIKEGIKVWTPQYALNKLKNAVFGIFAAEDIKKDDGNDGPAIYDSATNKEITIPTETSTHSGNHSQGAIYDEGSLIHESGAKLYFKRERNQSESNHYVRKYTTPEQKPATYSYTKEVSVGENVYTYDLAITMNLKAGGEYVTDMKISKTSKAPKSSQPDQFGSLTSPSAQVGDMAVNPAVNYESAKGNVLDTLKKENVDETNDTLVQEYDITYTQKNGTGEGMSFSWDGIEIFTKAEKNAAEAGAMLTVTNPFQVTPEISVGNEYKAETKGNMTTISASEPASPIYFLTKDGIRTEMYAYGGLTKTTLNIPMEAVDGRGSVVTPTIKYGEQILDWYSQLSPDNPTVNTQLQSGVSMKAERIEGDKNKGISYRITLLSNQKKYEGDQSQSEMIASQRPFSITYADGYVADIYLEEGDEGQERGILVLDGVDKTTRFAISDLVGTMTTGEDGKAVSDALPLGNYVVRELSAPEGYTSDPSKSLLAQLRYEDAFTPLVWTELHSINEAFSVEIDLRKAFETAFNSNEYAAGSGAVFGLYNAEPIAYGNGILEKDTCIDAISVGNDGRSLTSEKLPKGIYYIKELRTRDGYELDEMPYYFVVGDVKSAPLEISKEKDGLDLDGMEVKAYMEGYGKAMIEIRILKAEPMPEIVFNKANEAGKIYTEKMKKQTEADHVCCMIEVGDGETADLTLPNGKRLALTVDGSTYTYEYDDTKGQYVPDVAYTGYCAKYVLNGDNFKPQEVVISSWQNKANLSASTKKDAEGMISADIKVTGCEIAELKAGEKKEFRSSDNTVFTAELNANGDLILAVMGSLQGKLTQKEQPSVYVNGLLQSEGAEFAKSVTLTRQDSAAKSVQIKINSVDDLNSSEIKNDAKEVPSIPYTPYIPQPKKPSIGTTATDGESGTHTATADEDVTIVDTVSYSGLKAGCEYVLKGILMVKETGQTLLVNGKTVTAETKFTADKENGTAEVIFTFDGSSLGGSSLVVFEELYMASELNESGFNESEPEALAEHKDINDEGQTVKMNEPEETPEPEPEPLPKPQKPSKPEISEKPEVDADVPKTGDESNPWLWMVIMLISMTAGTINLKGIAKARKKA